MKTKSYISLGIASLAVLTGANAAEAAQLAPGKLSYVLNTGVFFTGNIIDFSPVQGGPRSLGVPGSLDITTSPFDIESGIFAEDPLPGDPRTFLNATGIINDLTLPKPVADSLPGGGIQDGITYDFATDFGIPGGEFALIEFDNDFDYIVSATRRTTTGNAAEGFDVRFDFTGFFRDNQGVFEDTPSVISFFNGTSADNPVDVPNIALADFADPSLFNNGGADGVNVKFISSLDGTITTVTVDIPNQVPEPASIMGLFGVMGLAGGLLKKKKA